jgi:HD superfamily phosphodiesterase
METEIISTVAQVAHYVEEVLGKERFRYVSAVVANCKMLALELEAEADTQAETQAEALTETDEEHVEASAATSVDMEALVMAAYLHDISTAAQGFPEHNVKSAEMAVEFLRKCEFPDERIHTVEQAILAHTTALAPEEREAVQLEGRILYDADKLGRLSGLAVVTSLIEFGARFPNRAVTGDVLVAILRHIEERFIELYQSFNTEPAREMAKEKFGNTLAFLDGVIEHLQDSTPV